MTDPTKLVLPDLPEDAFVFFALSAEMYAQTGLPEQEFPVQVAHLPHILVEGMVDWGMLTDDLLAWLTLNPDEQPQYATLLAGAAYIHASNLAVTRNNPAAAVPYWSLSAQMNPLRIPVWRNWGRSLVKIGREQEAVQTYLTGFIELCRRGTISAELWLDAFILAVRAGDKQGIVQVCQIVRPMNREWIPDNVRLAVEEIMTMLPPPEPDEGLS